jgi:hypothetical protein
MAHPGLLDLPAPRRSNDEVAAERKERERKKEEEQQAQKNNKALLKQFESGMRDEARKRNEDGKEPSDVPLGKYGNHPRRTGQAREAAQRHSSAEIMSHGEPCFASHYLISD